MPGSPDKTTEAKKEDTPMSTTVQHVTHGTWTRRVYRNLVAAVAPVHPNRSALGRSGANRPKRAGRMLTACDFNIFRIQRNEENEKGGGRDGTIQCGLLGNPYWV